MSAQEAIARLGAVLVSRAGGYLHNPVREDRQTCPVCTAPVSGFRHCFQCRLHLCHDGLADASAFLTYAVAGQQSGYVMRGYKAPSPLQEHRTIVQLLLFLGLAGHARCPGALAGHPVTHWATIPSLPAKPGEHPLHRLVGSLPPGREVRLAAAADVGDPRDISPGHFAAVAPPPRGAHVLLMDDTWASGGHAQSAVIALRRAGAARVSVLVVARWINPVYAGGTEFLSGLAGRDYDPGICPWTGAGCP
jgi:hypothetical protein